MGRRHAPYVKPGLYGGHTLACSCGWEDTTWRPGDGPRPTKGNTMNITTRAGRINAGHLGLALTVTDDNGSTFTAGLRQVHHEHGKTTVTVTSGHEETGLAALTLDPQALVTLTGTPDTPLRDDPTKKWTLYWRTGDRQVVRGEQIHTAMNNAGIGQGALPALDFYAEGDDQNYRWDAQAHTWQHIGGDR